MCFHSLVETKGKVCQSSKAVKPYYCGFHLSALLNVRLDFHQVTKTWRNCFIS